MPTRSRMTIPALRFPLLALIALPIGAPVVSAQSGGGPGSFQQALPSCPRGEWEDAKRFSYAPGSSITSLNFARCVAADALGRVHLVWSDQRDGNPEIYYKRSPDGGFSWGPEQRLTIDPADSIHPAIAVHGERVHLLWWDTRSGAPQLWARRSFDSGLSWSDDEQIVNSPAASAHGSIAVAGERVHVAYVDHRDGQAEVYVTRSLDAGRSWEAPRRISQLDHASYTPTIEVVGRHVYVAWTDTRHGGQPDRLEEEYFRRSVDAGLSWEAEVRLTRDPVGAPADSWAPSMVAAGNQIWLTWFDHRDGNWEIYFKHSDDRGVSWSADRRLTQDAAPSVRPVMARCREDLYITFWDGRDGQEEIYLLQSPDSGANWLPAERLTFAGGASIHPSLAVGRGALHLVWSDDRDGELEIYSRRIPGPRVPAVPGRIAFVRDVAGEPQLFSSRADGRGIRQLTTEGENLYPAWSKDGTRLVFTSSRSGSYELWSMKSDGTDLRQLSFEGAGVNGVPDWSYDGTRIAYARLDPAVGHPEVWIMNADGSGAQRMTVTPRNPSGFTWSLNPTWQPGDQRIYYASTVSGSSQIWGMFADGQGQEQKTFGLGPEYPHANAPEFARDGRLAFWAGFEAQFGEIWSWDLDAGMAPMQVTSTTNPRNSDNPTWAPDGGALYFDSNALGSVVNGFLTAPVAGFLPVLLLPNAHGVAAWQPGFPR